MQSLVGWKKFFPQQIMSSDFLIYRGTACHYSKHSGKLVYTFRLKTCVTRKSNFPSPRRNFSNRMFQRLSTNLTSVFTGNRNYRYCKFFGVRFCFFPLLFLIRILTFADPCDNVNFDRIASIFFTSVTSTSSRREIMLEAQHL